MWRFLACKKGITLVELMIGAALLSVVLGIGYMYYGFVNNAFHRGENRWQAQQDVRREINYIVERLRYAYEVQMDPPEPTGDIGDYDNYIFLKDGFYIHRYKDKDKVVQNRQILNSGNYTISFARVEKNKDDGITGYLNNVLSVTVASAEPEYSIETKVMMLNMPNTSITGGAVEADSLKFSSAKVEEVDPTNPPPPPSGCFIATAAFGSEFAPAVALLREFRDNYLLTSPTGEHFVHFYYRVSPPVAAYISNSEPLKLLVRILLAPVVGAVYLWMRCGPAILIPAVFLPFLTMYIIIKKKPRLKNRI